MVGWTRRAKAVARLGERARALWYEYGCDSRDLGGVHWRSLEAPEQSVAGAEWKASVTIGGVSRAALVAPIPSAAVFRTICPPRAAFVAEVALEESGREGDRGDVVFSLAARPLDGSPARTWARSLNAAGRWTRFVAPLEHLAGKEVDLVLSTSSPGRRSLPAVWGEPCLRVRRSPSELVHLVRDYRQRYGARHGLEKALGRLRSELLIDGTSYDAWLRRNRARRVALARQGFHARRMRYRPTISLLVLSEDLDPAALGRLVGAVRRQSYPFWELLLVDPGRSAPGSAIPPRVDDRIKAVGALGDALTEAEGDFVAFVGLDDELDPRALYFVARVLNRDPAADFVYTDEDRIDELGRRSAPFFKPGWSPDYLLSFMYTGRLSLYRRSLVQAAGGLGPHSGSAQEWDLALRIGERTGRIHHVPRVLYHRRDTHAHWDGCERVIEDHVRRAGMDAACEQGPREGVFRVRYRIAGTPSVSIVVPTAGRIRNEGSSGFVPLETCIKSVLERTAYGGYELLCVDDGSLDERTEELLRSVGDPRVRRLSFGERFSFARKINFAVEQATGEHVVFLNDDTEIINAEWLSAMIELSQHEGIGAVGAKLHFPGGGIQHGGVILASGRPTHAFYGCPSDHPGYFSNLLVVCNYSAVTAACMMTRRSVFAEAGGLNEAFPLNYNDVDYCLRLRERGYRIAFTPYAELRHFESLSREGRATRQELELFRRTWPIEHDPFYSPNFRQDRSDFTIAA